MPDIYLNAAAHLIGSVSNTMTCTNVSVKQYWYFRYFIKVPNGPRRAAEQLRGWKTRVEREREREIWSRPGFIALRVRVLSIIDLVAKVVAIHHRPPRILPTRSPRKSQLSLG